MEKRMNKKELLDKIHKEEFWILSSSALVLRDIYPDAGDLDIAVTQKGLQELMKNYNLVIKENGWFAVNDKIECVVDTKAEWEIEKVGGYNLESINKYYDYLLNSDRPKDKQRIPLVEEYIRNNS